MTSTQRDKPTQVDKKKLFKKNQNKVFRYKTKWSTATAPLECKITFKYAFSPARLQYKHFMKSKKDIIKDSTDTKPHLGRK